MPLKTIQYAEVVADHRHELLDGARRVVITLLTDRPWITAFPDEQAGRVAEKIDTWRDALISLGLTPQFDNTTVSAPVPDGHQFSPNARFRDTLKSDLNPNGVGGPRISFAVERDGLAD